MKHDVAPAPVAPAGLSSPGPSPLGSDAVAGVDDPALRAVVADHWEHWVRWSPTWATTVGDHRFDDQLAPRDAASIEQSVGERKALLSRLTALDEAKLDSKDRVTRALLRDRLAGEVALDRCKFHEWNVDAGGGSLFSEISYLVEGHTVHSPRDAENLVLRMSQVRTLIEATIANLELGLGARRVAAAEKVRRAIAQLDAELAKPSAEWSMAEPAWAAPEPKGSSPERPQPSPEQQVWPAGERERLAAELEHVVANQIVPALASYRDFLRLRVLPMARREIEGVIGLPDGEACYEAAIFAHVGLPMTARELHELGLREIARTDRELTALGNQVLGTSDLESTISKLLSDRALYFASREELLAAAGEALGRAKARQARFFAVLPKTECIMREVPDYEAAYSTIAYYRPPHYDGSKPGEYFVNTSKPETRPRFELEALTWHESIPGHHLQIALAQELGAMPAFRKLDGSTAFIEGWALYTERLADEMGLYSSDLDRLGKLSYDAWRSARLVVDTGLHALGWSRAQAEKFMREHTALTPGNISNEVDRYLGWPGQALAYKVGQLDILALRAEAERKLAGAFDLRQFHAVVLGAGAVTLPVLRERVRGWIAGGERGFDQVGLHP